MSDLLPFQFIYPGFAMQQHFIYDMLTRISLKTKRALQTSLIYLAACCPLMEKGRAEESVAVAKPLKYLFHLEREKPQQASHRADQLIAKQIHFNAQLPVYVCVCKTMLQNHWMKRGNRAQECFTTSPAVCVCCEMRCGERKKTLAHWSSAVKLWTSTIYLSLVLHCVFLSSVFSPGFTNGTYPFVLCSFRFSHQLANGRSPGRCEMFAQGLGLYLATKTMACNVKGFL